MNWILKHKAISIIIAGLLAVAVWYFFSGSSSSDSVLSTDQPDQAPQGTQDLVQSLLALQSVTLSGTIFSNPSFQVLRDFTTPITPEPAGRDDPFAPLGTSGSTALGASASTSSASPTH
jgi:hypothetical protein